MKFDCSHADACFPDYWSGHHLAHLSFPVYPGMTLADIKSALQSELSEGAIGGSTPFEVTESEEWYQAAKQAIDAIVPASGKTDDSYFNEVDEPAEDDDYSVYAYFVLAPVDE